MREKELRERAICGVCGNKFGNTGLPLFWTVTIERHGLKADEISRQDGLGDMLGSSALAQVMGADEEMTETLYGPTTFTVCETCANNPIDIHMMAERHNDE